MVIDDDSKADEGEQGCSIPVLQEEASHTKQEQVHPFIPSRLELSG